MTRAATTKVGKVESGIMGSTFQVNDERWSA
jgi:hypothetical protein